MHFARLTATLATLAAVTFAAHDALACGGCFHPPTPPGMVQTSVTNHRMAMAVHANDAILWDQIQYSGNPQDFSWVLPVFGNVTVELASPDFFDVLEAQTAVVVNPPPVMSCNQPTGGGGIGCGGAAGSAPTLSFDAAAGDASGVNVIHEATVGPYMQVTLRSTDPNALVNWLNTNGYAIPASIMPVIDFYVGRHMDFVALRLRPGEGVQAMQPVRVRYDSANMVLPLHMVSAGVSDKVGITLWVFGTGRYEAANAGNGEIDPASVVWDWTVMPNGTSNYAQLFENTIQALGGRAWITEFAQSASSINMFQFNSSATGGLADWQLATQNGGSFLTRLRTDLAYQFLDNDLQLQASANTSNVSNRINTTHAVGTPPGTGCSAIDDIPRDDDIVRKPVRTLLAFAVGALAFVVIRRRARRRSDS